MPSALTYPGVYIEEVSSGVRTITGVATSITAFVGRALRGPVNKPTTVNNFGEFERLFGGLAADHTVAYAVQDFFGNGGAQAIIVRLYKPFFPDDTTRATALAAATTQALAAANAINAAAATAAGPSGATPASVAAAAKALVIASGPPGSAALLAAQQVADAAQTEAAKPPYMTTAQRMAISGGPTGGSIKLKFGGAETAAIPLATLTGGTSDAALKAALEGLASIGAGNIASVAHTGVTPDFSFLITFGGTLAGPQSLITLSDNSLTGGASPTATISLPLPDAASVAAAAADAVAAAVSAAAGAVAPIHRARLSFANGLILEAATPGAWGNFLQVTVDYDTKPKDEDGSADPALYNLAITDRLTGKSERIRNVSSTASSARFISRVSANESSLVRTVGTVPASRPEVIQRMDISGGPTGGTIKLKLGGAETAAINLTTLTGATFEADLKAAFALLPAIGAGTIVSVVRSGVTPNYSFLISFGGTLAGPQSLISLSNNSLTGTADLTVAIALATISVGATDKAADSQLLSAAADFIGSPLDKTGLFALDKADLFNLLCIPPDTRDGDTLKEVYQLAMVYCTERRAMLIVDSPVTWSANPDTAAATAIALLPTLGLNGPAARNAALFFPRIKKSDPMQDGQVDTFVPCGAIAGIFTRTDSTRGVWKAPAGLDATINGIVGLQVNLADGENGQLNPLGINNLRSFPVAGQVVWGARTLRGADSIGDEYKYIPVRRTALFLEETLYRATKWVVFEPNDEPLWAQIRLNIGAFLQTLFRQGAFQGSTPKQAYFVKCDHETTTQNDINLGVVNIIVGFAPLKPAEFVVIKLQQIAGDIPT